MSLQKVCVFVFGDIGRSPRMQNHAIQLSKFYEVYFMGYLQSNPKSQVINNPRIHLIDMKLDKINKIKKISYYIYVLIRIIYQILQILYLLIFKIRPLKFILVQNPPSVPNLMGVYISSFFHRYSIYIDFHNYGYTILALTVKNRIVLKLAEKYQKFFGRRCKRAFCVSQKMKLDLKQKWNIEAEVLYDRPTSNAVRPIQNKQQFFKKYSLQIPKDQILCVSSTSWTKDQDFSILLNAVDAFQSSKCQSKLRVFITGKGPQKQFYVKLIQQKKVNWKKVSIETVWLQADDYPILLSLCHFGVCLHYSSSGLDLPMKIIDMFDAGLPVLAVNYPTLNELVKDGINGSTFIDKNDLLQKMIIFCENKNLFEKLKKNVLKQKEHNWSQQWNDKFIKQRQIL